MGNKLNILILEDVQSDAELIIHEVKKSGIHFDYIRVETEKDFTETLNIFKPDIVLSDYNLPQFNGMQALQIRNELFPTLPFIIVTGSLNEIIAVNCIKSGADDYILKDNLTRLGTAIESVLKKKEIIENKKNAEIALQESETRYQDLYENAPDMFISVDVETQKIIQCNKTLANETGFTKEEIIGRKFIELYHPDSIEEVKESYKHFLETGETKNREFKVKRKDGNWFYISLSATAVKDNTGKIISTRSIWRDIDKRKQAEKALAESNEFNKLLLQTFPFGMDIVDEEGNTLFISDKFKKIFGEDALGSKCWELYKDEKKQCDNCVVTNKINIGETKIIETSGVLNGRDFQIIHTGMVYNDKKAILEIFQDITDRKIAEEQLIIAKEKAEESDKLKSAFLANMSHEVRTPMNAIIGFSELLNDPDASDDEKKKFTQIIIKRSFDLLGIINDILDISRMEAGQLIVSEKAGDINDIFNELYDFFKSKNESLDKQPIELRMNLELPEDQCHLTIDFLRLRQVLINLIGNSYKFTTEGFIEYGCSLINNDTELLFYVKDSGIGIPKEKQSIIFNSFRQVEDSKYITRAYGGVGLGLSISKGLVELMNGKIWVESELNAGSTFYFTLPYKSNVKTDTINVNTFDNYYDNWSDKVILIVEDNEFNANYIMSVLREANITFHHTLTGKEALELIETNYKIDLIFMDIRLPDINGFDLTHLIKQKRPNIPIIAQTSYAAETDKQKCLNAGCDDYISKPIERTKLIDILKKYFVKK